MPHISIDLRQLQTIVCRSLYISRTLLAYLFRSPLLQILEPSTSGTGKDTVVRFNQQLHIALLFLNLLGLSHHFLTVFGSAFWLLLRLCKTLTIADPGGVSSSFSISIVGMFGMFQVLPTHFMGS